MPHPEPAHIPTTRRLRTPWIAPVLCFLLLVPAAAGSGAAKPAFTVYQTGDQKNVATDPTGGVVLMGGGPDVDAAFRWMLGRSRGGDVVVIRASGSDGYNDYLFTLDDVGSLADSVATFVFFERSAASEASVLQTVGEAEALFIAGGDQAEYVRLWDDTPLEALIEERVRQGMVIGGTSAGAMVLGEHNFTAARGTVSSRQALRDPFDRRVTVSSGFLALPALEGVIVDTHFAVRNRTGRLLAFLARIAQRDGPPARGVGLDEGTALLIPPNGLATIVGEGRVLFVQGAKKPERCTRGRALTYRALSAARGADGDTVAVTRLNGGGPEAMTLEAIRGRITIK